MDIYLANQIINNPEIYNEIQKRIYNEIHSQVYTQVYNQMYTQVYTQVFTDLYDQYTQLAHSTFYRNNELLRQIQQKLDRCLVIQLRSSNGDPMDIDF